MTTIFTAITAFIATNIDDILILMLFFSSRDKYLKTSHIIIGQYLGFTFLILSSLPGFFGTFIISKQYLGLLGIVPIFMGVIQLFKKSDNDDDDINIKQVTEIPENQLPTSPFFSKLTYAIAAVTVANGGDNIGLYVPLFGNTNFRQLLITLIVFYLLVGFWCYLAYRLIEYKAIATIFNRYIHVIIPFVWIGLGIFIILESGLFKL